MDTPQFRRNPNTREIEELQPVPAPTREQLVADLNAATERKNSADAEVDRLMADLETAEEEQEAANEDYTFRRARLEAWDKADKDSPEHDDEATGPDDEAMDGAGAGDSSPELADGGDREPSAGQPAKTTKVEVPVRRRADA